VGQRADEAAREAVDGPTDKELLARHVAGDAFAFSELVHRHQQRLWAVALRTLADPDEAADALQDALLAAFRRAATYRGEAAVTTWLHRIVVNACLDRMRRRAVRATVPLPAEEVGPATARDEISDRERSLDVAAALATLPADQRLALVLVDVQGYPVAEAARILEVPTGTVKSRCARGRARLLPLLAHLREGNRDGDESVPSPMESPDLEQPRSQRPGRDGGVQ
jgi:RNA polymerase sigma-70 factor (ECF subfamily)